MYKRQILFLLKQRERERIECANYCYASHQASRFPQRALSRCRCKAPASTSVTAHRRRCVASAPFPAFSSSIARGGDRSRTDGVSQVGRSRRRDRVCRLRSRGRTDGRTNERASERAIADHHSPVEAPRRRSEPSGRRPAVASRLWPSSTKKQRSLRIA